MPVDNSKAREIKRLTTPITLRDAHAYDCEGNLIDWVETISEVRFVIEPNKDLLTDDEILQYAPKSKAASEVRLKRGFGNYQDILLIHEALPWALGLIYIIIACIGVLALYNGNKFQMLLTLILIIIPLIYLSQLFNLNRYRGKDIKRKPAPKPTVNEVKEVVREETDIDTGVESLKVYGKEINTLKLVFDIKEKSVRELIYKRFTPPQITYDKFIAVVDSSHKLFYHQMDAANNIVNMAAEDTPRVQKEIENKITAMKTIIDRIENLTNELVINMSNENNSNQDVENLLNDMENLIDSVKEY